MNSTDKNNVGGTAVSRKGLRFILAGVLVLIAGYILLSGGGVKDPQVFNYAMFDFRRLVAAPLVMLSGIVVVIVGIMGKFEDK